MEREGYFDDRSYISGLPDDHHVRRNENVFEFSLSAPNFGILQMLTIVIAPCGISNADEQMYHLVLGLLDPRRLASAKEPAFIRRSKEPAFIRRSLQGSTASESKS